jgi:hypothetical protein
VRERLLGVREHQLLEQIGPHGALVRRQVADGEHRVQQRAVRRTRVRSVVPPVVHEHVERLERLDVVPPAEGDEQRVAGSELGVPGVPQGLGMAREPRMVGVRQRHHAHGRAGRREVERRDVQVGELLGGNSVNRRRPPATQAML